MADPLPPGYAEQLPPAKIGVDYGRPTSPPPRMPPMMARPTPSFSVLWALLGGVAFPPIGGLVMWFLLRVTAPWKARSALIGAIIAFALYALAGGCNAMGY